MKALLKICLQCWWDFCKKKNCNSLFIERHEQYNLLSQQRQFPGSSETNWRKDKEVKLFCHDNIYFVRTEVKKTIKQESLVNYRVNLR